MSTRSTLLVVLLVAAGCGNKSDAPPADSPDAKEAHRIFQTLCSTCHGTDGKGDGAAAASLNPKPRNYTDKAWQAKVTDDDIRYIILNGGAAVGKSPAMPAQTQLRNSPGVVDELVKIVRSFGT